MPRLRSVALGLLAVLSAAIPAARNAAAQTKAAPQLLPYTITAVAGGGPVTGSTTSTIATTYTATAFTVGQACASGSALTALDVYGDGCLATQVGLVLPYSVIADPLGNVYLVDGSHALIRRVDARTGIITAVAGQGSSVPAAGAACGSLTSTSALGDGCRATDIKLASPEAIAFDPADNLWFSDFNLGAVRRIDQATGIVTTVVNSAGTPGYRAGNVSNPGTVVPAAQGQLVKPYGITFDRAGNLYIADNYNSTLEVVNLQSAATTIAAVSIPSGAIFTIAGAGCAYGNSTTGCTTYGKTGAGGASTASTLDSPYQVAVDNSGNIYIADEFPYDIRVISGSTGIISTFANAAFTKSAVEVRGPAASTSLASTQGVATDANGNVYITVYDIATASPTATSGTGSSYLHRIDAATGGLYPIAGQFVAKVPTSGTANTANATAVYCATETDNIGDGCPGTQSTLYSPFQPFVDATGNVYFVDQKNLLIRKLSVNTQFPAVAAGTSVTQNLLIHFGAGDSRSSFTLPLQGSSFGSLDFSLGTSTCTTNSDTTQDCIVPIIFKPQGAGLRTANLFVTSASGLTSSFALTGTGNAALLLTDSTSNTGSTGIVANVTAPVALAGNSSDILYAVVPSAAGIQKLSNGAVTTLGTGLNNATAVTTDPAGNVFAALPSGSIVKIAAVSSLTSSASSAPAQSTLASNFTRPSGLATDALGNLYVADSTANTVTRIAAGTLTQRVIATAATGLNGPSGLAIDASGNLFIANTLSNNVVEVPASGAASLTLGTGLSAPRAVAVDASGALYVADTRNARIVFIPNENGTLTSADQLTVATLGLSSPTGLVLNPSGILYVADSTANAIYLFNRTAATQAFGNDSTGTQVSAAADIVSAGNLPVTFASPYTTVTGNTGDFTLTPTAGPATLAAGSGAALTAGFKPTATGSRQAVFTFAATNTAAPTLTVTGNGITPINATTTTIVATPTGGTYGQTITATFTVATPTGQAAATGAVTVKVDTTTYSPTLTAGVATLSLSGLSAGAHTITASYTGDATSNPSTATPVTVTLVQAPLAIAISSVSKQYLAALPTFTGTITGTVNGDAVTVAYATTATQTSPVGTYPITATLTGNAAINYAATVTPGVLTITRATTTTLLTASATAVSSTAAVTLTATVTPATSGVPTGSVGFYSGTALLVSVPVGAGGTASTTTTFAVGTASITAVYTGDTNYATSTSPAVVIVSSIPGFTLTGTPTALSVVQGQTAVSSFTLTPTFGYSGTISFSCANLPATMNCIFSPTSIVSTGTNTASLVAVDFTTVQPGGLASLAPRPSALSFAAIPGLALLLAGFSRRRRRSVLRAFCLLAAFALTLGAITGCGSQHLATPTPTGTYNITVNATGTPNSAGSANVAQTFTVALTVK